MHRSLLFAPLLFVGCANQHNTATVAEGSPTVRGWDSTLINPQEKHFKHLKRITYGGDNAEAYWSFAGKKIIFQSTNPNWGESCDQIHIVDPFTQDLREAAPQLISVKGGRTTCSYFLPGDRSVLFASTHEHNATCPAVPERRADGKYVWPIYPSFDIHVSDLEGNLLRKLTDSPGYDAEATVCPVTGRIVFTSTRDGDLELYTMEPNGADVQRLTNREGYDGGAFFSHDGSKIVARSGFFKDDADRDEYFNFLKQDLILPTQVDIVVMDRDGKNFHRVTDNGQANFAPYWHPDNHRIIFCSNIGKAKNSRDFDLWLIGEDGQGLERVTFNDTFDGFPMFSPDGKHIAFASNRYGEEYGETSLFVAEWVD